MSKKSGNNDAGKSYDYFGTIAGVFGIGPFEGLSAFIVDGDELWPNADVWEDGETILLNDLRAYGGKTYKALSGHTASTVNAPPDVSHWEEYFLDAGLDDSSPLTIDNFGDVEIFWGTQTQDVSTLLNDNEFAEEHPSYVGVGMVVLIDCLFGRERTSAPNVEVVVRKRANQEVIVGTPAALSDGQANMMAVAAELFTSENALGLSTTALDPLSFQDAADALDESPELTAASPMFDSQDSVAAFLDSLGQIADAFIRFNANTGLIEAGVFSHGEPPVSYATLTIDDVTERPQFDAGGWPQAKTRAVVSFTDRARGFKQSSDKADDLRAYRVLQEHRPLSLQRDAITRRSQAIAHAAETLRTSGRPQTSGNLLVRREKGRNIRPGDYVRFDIDIEPGGSELLQYFRVKEREIPFNGPIRFTLEADVTLSPIPYTPGDNPQPVSQAVVDAIAYQRVFEASLTLGGGPNTIMVLAERPSSLITGFHLYYDQDTGGSFQRIGTATGFATRATLRTNLTDSATTIEITLPAQVDTDRIAVQPGDIAAADDNLLAILLDIDTGQVDEDADGYAIVEVCSISAQALASGSNYDLTVLRGRQGTRAKAFTTSTAEVWIIPRASLIGFIHADFATLRANKVAATTPDTAYFRLAPFTYVATRDLGDCSSVTFQMPTKAQSAPSLDLTLPATNPLSVSSPYPHALTVSGTWSDLDGDLTSYQIFLKNPAGTEEMITDEVFTQTDSIDFSVDTTIDTTGTWILTLKGFDAAGLVTTHVVTINAGAGTAKPAKPKVFCGGSLLRTYVTSAFPTGSLLSGYGVFGEITATCATFGATITMRWRQYFGGWGAFSAFASTQVYNSTRWTGTTMLFIQVEVKATRSGVDSDVETITLASPAGES